MLINDNFTAVHRNVKFAPPVTETVRERVQFYLLN